MAEHLASIFGTEKDRVNCPFYFKIGACRHGDRCSRLHNKPTISPTLLLQNMYQNPVLNAPLGADGLPLPVDPKKVQEFFEDFYEDIFEELAKFGEVEYLNVCDNLADHMVGNCYVKFRDEDAAARALAGLQGRYYAGKPIVVEFSPVTDFREATCRQYEEGTCGRGGYCNFMHVRPVSKTLRKQLFGRFRDGTGGSTRFHDTARERDRGGRYDDRPRHEDRGRRYDRGDRRYGGRDSSAERRANIARWNAEAAARASGGGEPAAPPLPGPAAVAGGYSAVPTPHVYGMPQSAAAFVQPAQPPPYQPPAPTPYESNNGYGGGGGYRRGPSSGGSGANTVPIANMRTFPYQQQ